MSEFQKNLSKEKNPIAQNKLKQFYKKYYKGYQIKDVPYSDNLGQHLQTVGVDKILYQTNQYNYIQKQLFVQEKVCSWNYNDLIFEYKKMSGKDGWAIDEGEISDVIVYYLDTQIIVFDTKKLREWLLENLRAFISKYKYKTDNANLRIPKDVIYDSLDVDVFYWNDDDECWKRKLDFYSSDSKKRNEWLDLFNDDDEDEGLPFKE